MKKIILFSFVFLGTVQGVDKEPEPDINKKMRDAQELVTKAVQLFKQKTIAESCRIFLHDERWQKGELFVFIFDELGVCYCYGDQRNVIWKSFYNEKNILEKSFIVDMLNQGEKGGWMSYGWLHGLQNAYVKVVKKGGKRYILGTGFYPESSEFITYEMVKDAARFLVANGAEETFERINNPYGKFVKGDIYLWVYDFNGKCFAHGENLAMVGQDLIDWQDTDGKYRNRDMIKMVSEAPSGSGWIDYTVGSADKRAYVQKVIDPKTQKPYIIGGGYYPKINDQTVLTFINKAINHLKTVGKTEAFRDFSSKTGGFVLGPLTIFVYDMKGVMLADSENPDFIGQNLIKSHDPEGRPITKMIVDQAKKFDKGWVSFVDHNAYKQVYVQKIVVPDGEFVIGSGYFPESKPFSTRTLVEKASRYLQTHNTQEALLAFTSENSDFVRGDLSVFVYNQDGTCFAQGLDHQRIWRNEADLKDTKGERISNKLITVANAGGGWLEYSLRNATYRLYVKTVEKEVSQIVQEEFKTKSKSEKSNEVISQKGDLFVKELSQQEESGPEEVERLVIGAGYFV
ncbi:MAG: cache domain-containing protein [Candidatus Babeliaceae bacterium]